MSNEKLMIKREAVPVIFKVIADTEILLTELTGCHVSLEMKLNSPALTKEEILKISVQGFVVSEFGTSWVSLIGSSRKRNLVDARKAYCHIMSTVISQKLVETAADLHIHHTSAMYLRESATQLMSINDPIKSKIENIKAKLYEHEHLN